MQFISKMIKSVWSRPTNDVYLIGCQHLDLNIGDVREEINRISNLQGAIAHDIAAGGKSAAEVVDAHLQSDAASQLAALILTASLSESIDAVKGFTKPQMLECLIAPNRDAIEFQDAFEALRSGAWYLHRKDNDAFYFSNIENLKKRIDNRAERRAAAEDRRRDEAPARGDLPARHKIAYQEVHALPQLDEIKLNGPRVCLVLSPDSKLPPQEAQRFWEGVTEKNNFCVVTGDGSSSPTSRRRPGASGPSPASWRRPAATSRPTRPSWKTRPSRPRSSSTARSSACSTGSITRPNHGADRGQARPDRRQPVSAEDQIEKALAEVRASQARER